MEPDMHLVHRARMVATGATIHKLNNLLAAYIGSCEASKVASVRAAEFQNNALEMERRLNALIFEHSRRGF